MKTQECRVHTVSRRPDGFSICQVLMVTVLVGALVSIGFAGMASIVAKSKVVSTETIAIELEDAFALYRAYNGVFPVDERISEGAMVADQRVVAILLGSKGLQIPHSERWRDRDDRSKKRGIARNGVKPLIDSFGGFYHVVVDANGDGRVNNPDPTSKQRWLEREILVFSPGPDGNPNTWSDNIKTWK